MTPAARALGAMLACGALLGAALGGPRAASVQTLERLEIPFPEPPMAAAAPRVNKPYFDAQGRLRWNETFVHTRGTGSCDSRPLPLNANGFPVYPRVTRLLTPRVDERRCAMTGADGRGTTETTLIGLDPQDRVTWERRLGYPSGAHRIDQQLVGATPDGLVLSDLEVLSPSTGATLRPGPFRLIEPERRRVPVSQVGPTVVYHPTRAAFLVFDAEVTLLSRRGGLYRLDSVSGERELLHPVSSSVLGEYDRVEAMVPDPDGRHLFLARRLTVRGPGSVSFAVFDLDRRTLVFEQRHGKRCVCLDPTVVVATDGHVGFAYRDESARHHVLVHYRLLPDDGR